MLALLYLLAAGVAFLGSEVLLTRWVPPADREGIRVVRSGIGIALTSGLVYGMGRWTHSQFEAHRDRLDTQRTELQVLHRVLRHNLRNDLTLISGHADSLLDDLSKPEDRESCAAILETAESIMHYTDQAQKIRRATEDDELVEIPLRERIQDVVDGHPRLHEGATVEITCPADVVVRANPMLPEAISELLSNAVEHTDGDPRIHVEVERDESTALIRVADDGPGMPYRVRDVLEQGREKPLLHLSGMGLWFVYSTVVMSGGEFEVANAEGGGAIVTLRLPVSAS